MSGYTHRRGRIESCKLMGLAWFICVFLVFTQSAGCEVRNFRMALWNNPRGADADVALFTEGQAQPGGNSVLLISSWRTDDFAQHWNNLVVNRKYDLSRIEAVLVDEPYWNALGTHIWSNPCRDNRKGFLQAAELQLGNVAFAIKQTSPQTRFWVNFSEPEVQWMMDAKCPAKLNQEYIDVISVDVYWKSFNVGVKPYYSWLIAHRVFPGQQIALVPGTFFREGKDEQLTQAAYLKGYFDYADRLNKKCEIPLGPTGATDKSDGCLVWIVVGWMRETWRDRNGVVWRGEGDPNSSLIRAVWHAKQKVRVNRH